jgi:hypothetical protein
MQLTAIVCHRIRNLEGTIRSMLFEFTGRGEKFGKKHAFCRAAVLLKTRFQAIKGRHNSELLHTPSFHPRIGYLAPFDHHHPLAGGYPAYLN